MRRALAFAALSLVVLSTSASAQRGRTSSTSVEPSPEVGVDAGVTFGLGTPSTTSVDIPVQRIRMGFFVSPVLSIEPSLALSSTSFGGGGGSLTAYDIGVAALYHFSPSRMMRQFYVRPFIDFLGQPKGLTNGTDSGIAFGGGLGAKFPINDRFSSRFEGNLAHASIAGASENSIGLLAGVSVYTH
jgi:hypothetical protein